MSSSAVSQTEICGRMGGGSPRSGASALASRSTCRIATDLAPPGSAHTDRCPSVRFGRSPLGTAVRLLRWSPRFQACARVKRGSCHEQTLLLELDARELGEIVEGVRCGAMRSVAGVLVGRGALLLEARDQFWIEATRSPSKWTMMVLKRFRQYFHWLDSSLGVACAGG
jgi:hypothetical protein